MPVQVGAILTSSAGAPSERMAVIADPLTAVSPSEAEGLARAEMPLKDSPAVPTLSLRMPASSAEVVEANTLSLLAVYATVPPVPSVMVEASVPARVSVLLTVSVLPSAIVSVALVAGAVIATLLRDVAVATPSVGVTSAGDVLKTAAPVPVGLLSVAKSWAEVVAANCDSGEPVTPQVGQAIVPVVVIVPPVMGVVVARLVTVPLPPPPPAPFTVRHGTPEHEAKLLRNKSLRFMLPVQGPVAATF